MKEEFQVLDCFETIVDEVWIWRLLFSYFGGWHATSWAKNMYIKVFVSHVTASVYLWWTLLW